MSIEISRSIFCEDFHASKCSFEFLFYKNQKLEVFSELKTIIGVYFKNKDLKRLIKRKNSDCFVEKYQILPKLLLLQVEAMYIFKV